MQLEVDSSPLQSFRFVTIADGFKLSTIVSKKVILDEAGISLWQRHETVQATMRQPTNLVFVYNNNRNLYF